MLFSFTISSFLQSARAGAPGPVWAFKSSVTLTNNARSVCIGNAAPCMCTCMCRSLVFGVYGVCHRVCGVCVGCAGCVGCGFCWWRVWGHPLLLVVIVFFVLCKVERTASPPPPLYPPSHVSLAPQWIWMVMGGWTCWSVMKARCPGTA
jgi:hypothetical protein